MADSKFGELGNDSKEEAKAVELVDGPSNFPSPGENDWLEKGGEEEDVEMDPLAVFGSGIMTMILRKLDARSVAQARLVSGGWLAVTSSDKIWAPKELFHMFRNWHIKW